MKKVSFRPVINNAIILAGGRGSRLGRLTSFGQDMKFGNMHKVTLPVACTPNIIRIIDHLNGKSGVNNFHISLDYMKGDVLGTLERGHYANPSVKIFPAIREKPEHTGTAVKEIIFDKFKGNFEKSNYFWLVMGDKSFPTAALSKFQDEFLNYASSHKNVMGAMGFVLRPAEELLREKPTAILSDRGVVKQIIEPMTKIAEADDVFKSSSHASLASFRKKTGQIGVPLSMGVYILHKNIFKAVPMPAMEDTMISYDIGRYILPKLVGNLWGFVFDEPVINGSLYKSYYDIGLPEHFYNAQWAFVKTAKHILGRRDPETGNWLSNDIEIKGRVRDSVIDDRVKIGPNCTVTNSIIGFGCELNDVVVENSVLLPYSYVNLLPNTSSIKKISNSIVGGKIRGGSFIDQHHIVNHTEQIIRSLAIPNAEGIVEISDLPITKRDIELCKDAFEK